MEDQSSMPMCDESHNINEPDLTCDMTSFRPKQRGRCINRAGFTFFFGTISLMTSTCSVYMMSQLTALEKYFGFSSFHSGFLLSCNEIGFMITSLVISHFASKLHIPRSLSLFTMLFGIAAILCSFAYFGSNSTKNRPHFIIKPSFVEEGLNISLSIYNGLPQQLCDGNRTGTTNTSDVCADEISAGKDRIGAPTGYTPIAFSIMAIGLIMQGMGKGPRVPFAATYIDNNGVKLKTAMYVGIISCMGIFGPVIAFSLGSVFSRIYVTLEDVPIKPNDPRWVGAWWLGFILFGSMSIVVSVPILCFPRRLISGTVLRPTESKISMKQTFKDFTREIYQLIQNPVYMLIVVCGILDLFAISASISFSPKYMETQFSLPAWKANMMIGLLIMISAGLGSVIGGCVVSKFKFSPFTCLKCLMVIKVLFTVITFTDFFIGCSNPPIVNYNSQMGPNNTCVSQCNCDVTDYFPICGSDGRNYFSPCQAGCIGRENLLYTNCTCAGYDATARPGLCPSGCKMMYVFVIMITIGSFVCTFGMMPSFIFTIRSVTDQQKSLALGLKTFLNAVLGWLPAPVLYGKVVDSSCEVWSSNCKGQGACALYDIEDFRVKRAAFGIMFCFLIICLQWVLFGLARKKKDWSTEVPVTDIISESEVQDITETEMNNIEY